MFSHLEDNHILYPNQHGFRSRLSTETQLVTFVDELTSEVSRGGQVDAIILDFSKAFDKVCHKRLLYKLSYCGITGITNKWIKSFLTNREQIVVVNQEASEPLPVCSGIPQGTVLGPLLFLAFINDMPISVTSSKIRLFADDAIIYKNRQGTERCRHLTKYLASLEKWEKHWRMEFNPSKCHSISFTRLRNPITHTYSLHQTHLEKLSSAN